MEFQSVKHGSRILTMPTTLCFFAEWQEILESVLQSMEDESSKLEMHISWTKTKVQNLGAGPDAQNLVVNGHTVDGVSEFIYLGSKQSSHANSSTECIPLLPVS